MWPLLLDMTEEESIQSLRHLELEAYSSLVSALRAQGCLSSEKRKLLRETGILLSISNERHKAEVRRAISDERLNTIAYHITGQLNSLEDWAQEGRRLIPLLPRIPPQTPYSVVADEASETAAQQNKHLPLPANTERKRPSTPQSVIPNQPLAEPGGKPQIFRVPEIPKDEPKKRKGQNVNENSSLAQHLLGPKLSKIQQIYRQASKSPKQRQKDNTPDKETTDHIKSNLPQHITTTPNYITPKINIIQNISLPVCKEEVTLSEETVKKEIPKNPLLTNENQAPITAPLNIKPLNNTVFIGKQSTSTCLGDSEQAVDTSKINITKKQISKGQKLIVVSNPQTLPTNSILQKTLSVPMNKLTKLNLEKFKIVPNSQLPSSLQVTNVINNQQVVTPKPKMVTIKGNSGKKVIPLSQLQMLNPKGSLKVVPYSGKMLDKNISLNSISPDNYFKKSIISLNSTHTAVTHPTSACSQVITTEKVKVEVNGLLENGEKVLKDYDMKISDYGMPRSHNNELELDSNESLSTESSEASDMASNEDTNIDNMLEMDSCEFMDTHQDNEILEEFEVVHSEELLQ